MKGYIKLSPTSGAQSLVQDLKQLAMVFSRLKMIRAQFEVVSASVAAAIPGAQLADTGSLYGVPAGREADFLGVLQAAALHAEHPDVLALFGQILG